MKTRRLAAALAAALSLAGCKHEVGTEIYVSDIMKAEPGTTGSAVARIRAQVPAKQTCDDQGTEITKLLKTAFHNVRDVRCEAEGMNAYLTAAADIPLLAVSPAAANDVSPPRGSVLSFAVVRKEDGTKGVLMLVETKAVQDLRAQLKRRFLQDLPAEDIRLKVLVNNDGAGAVAVTAQSAFINGEPSPFASEVTVERRDKLEIVMSDVATAFIAQNGKLLVAQMPSGAK